MPQSPTVELSVKKMRTQLERAKNKEASQSQAIEKLTKEKEELLAEVAKCKYHIKNQLLQKRIIPHLCTITLHL